MKRLLLILSLACSSFIFSNSAFASEMNGDLTKNEVDQLKNDVGLSDELIQSIEIEEARELIEENAVLLSHVEEIITFDEFSDSIVPYGSQGGDLNAKQIKLSGDAYKVTNNNSSYKGQVKLKFVGNWEWLSAPINAYKDGFAIGWPTSEKVKLPTSNNGVDEFSADYYRWDSRLGKWYLTSSSKVPRDYEPNGGTGWIFDLRQGGSLSKGSLTQYAYTNSKTGSMNYKFTYGHAQLLLNPSLSISKGVFGVVPGNTVKVGHAAGTVTW
ncbi:hypothetical protein ABE042_22090 [Viridibacillus arvi]|uniref:hypothetical protein n=1 Tax=Viridibacillus arvi TaxID=263475 RepID=UPI003D2802DD